MRKCPRCKQKRADFLFNEESLICNGCKGKGEISPYILRKQRQTLLKVDFERAKKEQNSKCKMCENEVELVAYYSRFTGAFRGLVCNKCLTIVGLLLENPITAINLHNSFILDNPPLKIKRINIK